MIWLDTMRVERSLEDQFGISDIAQGILRYKASCMI